MKGQNAQVRVHYVSHRNSDFTRGTPREADLHVLLTDSDCPDLFFELTFKPDRALLACTIWTEPQRSWVRDPEIKSAFELERRGDLTANGLLKIRLGRLVDAAHAAIYRRFELVETGTIDDALESERTTLRRSWEQTKERTVHRRGKALTPLHYAHVASDYTEHMNDQSLFRALATKYGISANQVRRQLSNARSLGLLTPTRRGVKGGTLTDKALQLLRDEADGTR